MDFDNCNCFKVVDGSVDKTEVASVRCEKHEAQTKFVYHVCNITDGAEVVIKCSDTHILGILLGNISHLLYSSLKVWIDIDTGNNQKYIGVTSLYHKIGELLLKALPVFHGIMGREHFSRRAKQDLRICY